MDVEVTEEDQWGAVLWEGAEEGVEFVQETSQGTWRAIDHNNEKLNRAGYGDSMVFECGYRQVGEGESRELPGGGEQQTSTTTTAGWPRGVREGEGGREGSRGGGVLWCDPGLGEGEELEGLEGGICRNEVSLPCGRLAVPQPPCDYCVVTGGQRGIAEVGGVPTSWRTMSQRASSVGERADWDGVKHSITNREGATRASL